MTGIQASTGLITGIPIQDTVAQLLKIEARPRDLLVSRTENINDEATAIAELTASVLSLQFTAQKFGKSTLFSSTKATSSNTSFLSATVTGTPKTGNYQFTPVQTAQSQQLLSSGVASLTQSLGAGKIEISHGPRLDDGISLDLLNGGGGVQRGKIRITDRSGDSSTIDLSYAQTIDEVLDAINNDDTIQVTAATEGDQIRLTDTSGQTTSNLIVQGVGSSSTAADLGLASINTSSNTALGDDLLSLSSSTLLSTLNDNNGISSNSSLADLRINLRDGSSVDIELGQGAAPEDFASATLTSGNAQVAFTSVLQGSDYAGVEVIFQDNAAVSQGGETVAFDAGAKTLTFQIKSGKTTAADIIDALNNDATASQYFTASNASGSTGDGIIDPAKDSVTTTATLGNASTTTTAANANAAIALTADNTGGTYDDISVVFVDDAGVTAGAETVTYDDSDPQNKTLTVRIDAGNSSAANVIAAINTDPTIGGLFTADNGSGSDGTGLVDVSDTGVTSGGVQQSTATLPDDAVNEQVLLTAKVKGAASDNVTLQYVADETVTQGNEVVEFDESDPNNRVITVRIAEGSTTSTDVVTALNNTTEVSALFTATKPSGATGDRIVDASASATTAGGAEQFESQPETLGDLIDKINATAPTKVRAQLSANGDQIELVDLTSDNGSTFSVESINNSSTAEDLGLTGAAVGNTISSTKLQSGLKTTLLSSLGGGNGLGTLGSISISDRSGANATIDLSGSETVEDILREINNAGLGVLAEVNDAGNGIVLRDTTGQFASNFIVSNADGTNSATLLNIEHDATTTTVNSGNLERQFVSEQTRLDDLRGGQGIERGKVLILNSAGVARLFDLNDTTIETVGDLVDKINSEASLQVEATINDAGDGISLVDKSSGSGSLTVSEGGNTNTAAQLGILGSSEKVDIDGIPRNVITGSQVTTVDIESGDTLQTVIDKINNLDLGISASSLNTGSGSNPVRLSLVSTISGSQGRIQIDSSASSFGFEEIVKARDAKLLFGSTSNASAGILTSSSSNSFREVLDGVSLTINEATTTSVNVKVEASDAPLVAAAEDFVKQYNALRDKLEEHTFFNEADNSTGVLFGSNEALRVDSELSSLITSRIPGLGKFQSLEQLGFNFSDTGKLSLDKAKLQAAFQASPDDVEQFFLHETRGFADKIDNLSEQFAGKGNSLLVNRAVTLQARADLNVERISFFNERLERKSEQLLKQFYNLEITIGKLQNNLTAISGISYIGPENV